MAGATGRRVEATAAAGRQKRPAWWLLSEQGVSRARNPSRCPLHASTAPCLCCCVLTRWGKACEAAAVKAVYVCPCVRTCTGVSWSLKMRRYSGTRLAPVAASKRDDGSKQHRSNTQNGQPLGRGLEGGAGDTNREWFVQQPGAAAAAAVVIAATDVELVACLLHCGFV